MTSFKEYQPRVETIGEQLDQLSSQVIGQNRKYVIALMESQQGIAGIMKVTML